jgi:hypothetical protein
MATLIYNTDLALNHLIGNINEQTISWNDCTVWSMGTVPRPKEWTAVYMNGTWVEKNGHNFKEEIDRILLSI